jgi:hypothetical protein
MALRATALSCSLPTNASSATMETGQSNEPSVSVAFVIGSAVFVSIVPSSRIEGPPKRIYQCSGLSDLNSAATFASPTTVCVSAVHQRERYNRCYAFDASTVQYCWLAISWQAAYGCEMVPKTAASLLRIIVRFVTEPVK